MSSRRLECAHKIYVDNGNQLAACAHIYVRREDGCLLRDHRSMLQACRGLLIHYLLRLRAGI